MYYIGVLLVCFLNCVYVVVMYELKENNLEGHTLCNDNIANKDIPMVYLTLSPISTVSWLGKITQRRLVLNWNWKSWDNGLHKKYNKTTNLSSLDGDWVGLFSYNLSNGMYSKYMKPLQRYAIQGNKSHHGRIVTSSLLPVFNQPLTVKRQCLGNFFIGYIRNDTVLNSKCFETSPRWMQKMQDIIQDVLFTHLMIPGTHNSGAIKKFEGYFAHNIFNRFSINQEESVWNQLIMGIRYLDIRLKLDNCEEAYIVHNSFTFSKLKSALLDIKHFLDETNEIVFLNIHRFNPKIERTAKDSNGHRMLKKQLKEFFQDYMVHYSKGSNNLTLRQCWNEGKRLFVSYQHSSYNKENFLWPGVKVYWSGSSRTPTKLHDFLEKRIVKMPTNEPVSAMAHLSFQFEEVRDDVSNLWFGDYDGIRYMADRLAANGIDEWFQYEFWEYTNFVASDFFLSNNLIQISKEVNIRRHILKKC